MSANVEVARPSPVYKRPFLTPARREALWSLVFTVPPAILFLVFVAIPVVWGLVMSLFRWHLILPLEFKGLGNYLKLLQDERARQVLLNTLIFGLETIPGGLLLSLFLAVLLNTKIRLGPRAMATFRAIYFLPLITAPVAVGQILGWLFAANEYGLLNIITNAFFGVTVKWLFNTRTVLHCISFMTIWRALPGGIILYLAALQAVPRELYEAAELDGAGGIQKFFYVTWPMVTPVTFYSLILGVINSAVGGFDLVASLTQGGPLYASNIIGYYIYQQGFSLQRMGYASAIAAFMFIVTMILTIIQWTFQDRWVYYEL